MLRYVSSCKLMMLLPSQRESATNRVHGPMTTPCPFHERVQKGEIGVMATSMRVSAQSAAEESERVHRAIDTRSLGLFCATFSLSVLPQAREAPDHAAIAR